MENEDKMKIFKELYLIIDEVDMFIDPTQFNLFIETKINNLDKKIIEDIIKKIYRLHFHNTIGNINNDNKIRYYYDRITKMIYNKDYGIEYKNDSGYIFNIAVPYYYVNVPIENSSFTDLYIKIITTIFSYFKKTIFTQEQTNEFFKSYLSKDNKQCDIIKAHILKGFDNKLLKSDNSLMYIFNDNNSQMNFMNDKKISQ